MKFKIAALVLVLSATSQAALYTLTTGANAAASGISNAAGVNFQNSANAAFAGPGVVGFGIFTSNDDSIREATSASTLVSNFQIFGGTVAFNAPGAFGTSGVFSDAASATVTGTSFSGQNMYVMVGNGTTFANSTEFLVLKTTFVFSDANDAIPTPTTNTITTQNAAILFGTAADDVRTTTTDGTVTPGWRTAVFIPEPSTALLGAIGALGLLRRRRN